MPRSEITQVTGYPKVIPEQDRILQDLGNILTATAGTVAGGINLAAQFKGLQNLKLDIKNDADRMTIAGLDAAASEMEQDRKKMAAIENDNWQAYLATIPDQELRDKTATNMGIKDPKNVFDADLAIGTRSALRDYADLKRSFLDPENNVTGTTPTQIYDKFIAGLTFSNVVQEAGYKSQMLGMVRQDTEQAAVAKARASAQAGFDSAVFNLERSAASNAYEWTKYPNLFGQAIDNAYNKMKKFNPATSELDMQNVLANNIIPQILGNLDPRDAVVFAVKIAQGEFDNKYLKQFSPTMAGAIVAKATSDLAQWQGTNSRRLNDMVTSSRYGTELLSTQVEAAAAFSNGAINTTQKMQFDAAYDQQSSKVILGDNIRGKVSGQPGFEGFVISKDDKTQDAYEAVLQEADDQYAKEHYQPGMLAVPHMPPLEMLDIQLNAGRLSRKEYNDITTLLESPIVVDSDGTVSSEMAEEGIKRLIHIQKTAPNLYRDAFKDTDNLSNQTKLAISRVQFGDDLESVLTQLVKVKNEDMKEAETAFTNDQALAAVRSANDSYWPFDEPTIVGQDAEQGEWFKSTYEKNYALNKTGDTTARAEAALKQTKKEARKLFVNSYVAGRNVSIPRYKLPKDQLGTNGEVVSFGLADANGNPNALFNEGFKPFANQVELTLFNYHVEPFYKDPLSFGGMVEGFSHVWNPVNLYTAVMGNPVAPKLVFKFNEAKSDGKFFSIPLEDENGSIVANEKGEQLIIRYPLTADGIKSMSDSKKRMGNISEQIDSWMKR